MSKRFVHGGVYYGDSGQKEGDDKVLFMDKETRDQISQSRNGLYLPKLSATDDVNRVLVECMLNEFANWNNNHLVLKASIKNDAIRLRIYETLRYLGYMINCDSYNQTEMTEYDARELNRRIPDKFN